MASNLVNALMNARIELTPSRGENLVAQKKESPKARRKVPEVDTKLQHHTYIHRGGGGAVVGYQVYNVVVFPPTTSIMSNGCQGASGNRSASAPPSTTRNQDDNGSIATSLAMHFSQQGNASSIPNNAPVASCYTKLQQYAQKE